MTLRAGDLSQHFDFEKDSLWLCQIVFVMSSSRTGTMISAYVRIDARSIKTLRKFRMKMRLNVHSSMILQACGVISVLFTQGCREPWNGTVQCLGLLHYCSFGK